MDHINCNKWNNSLVAVPCTGPSVLQVFCEAQTKGKHKIRTKTLNCHHDPKVYFHLSDEVRGGVYGVRIWGIVPIVLNKTMFNLWSPQFSCCLTESRELLQWLFSFLRLK